MIDIRALHRPPRGRDAADPDDARFTATPLHCSYDLSEG
jgi:hypothetical protein